MTQSGDLRHWSGKAVPIAYCGISLYQPVKSLSHLLRWLGCCHRPQFGHDLQEFGLCDEGHDAKLA